MNKSTKTCVSIKKQEIPSAKNVTLQSNKTPSSRVLMDWINGELDVNMKTMKQLNNGAIYCQLIHKIFPQALPVRKVNFQAHGSLDIEANFRLLQSAFTRLGINHAVSPLELTRGLGHFKFVTWFQKFYAANKKTEAKAFPEAHKLKRSRTSTLLQPEQRTRGVHVAPRSQSVVGKPVIRRLDPPEVASASASPPVTASAALQKLRAQPFVSMIPKLKTYSLGNIHRTTAEPLQNASRLDSSNARRWLQEDEARATAAEEMVQPELPAVETAIESILYQEEIPIFIPPLNLESPDEETDVEEAENVEAVKEATKAASPREDTPKTGDPKDVFEVPTEKAAKDASPREVAKEAAPRQATRIDTPRVTAKKITRRKTAKETTRRKGAKDATLCEVAKDAAPRQAAKEATRKETTKESSEKAVPKEDAPEESAAKPKQYKTTSNIAVAVHPGDGRKQDEAITRALSELTDESAAAFASDADSDCDSITILLSENRMLEKIVDRVRSIATDIRLDCNKALRKIRKLLMLHYVEKYEMVNNQ